MTKFRIKENMIEVYKIKMDSHGYKNV